MTWEKEIVGLKINKSTLKLLKELEQREFKIKLSDKRVSKYNYSLNVKDDIQIKVFNAKKQNLSVVMQKVA